VDIEVRAELEAEEKRAGYRRKARGYGRRRKGKGRRWKNECLVLCRLIHIMARNSSHHGNLLGMKSMLFGN
jgi:hypothetical protein